MEEHRERMPPPPQAASREPDVLPLAFDSSRRVWILVVLLLFLGATVGILAASHLWPF